MKFALPFALCVAFAMPACNTIENRRSLYARREADGPYTRSLQDGSWRKAKTIDEQYEESKREKSARIKVESPKKVSPDAELAPL